MVISKKCTVVSLLLCAISTSVIAVKHNKDKQHAPRQFPLPSSPELEASLQKMKEKPKKKSRWQPMCPTIEDNKKAPNFVRELAYEALTTVGYDAPDKIYTLSIDSDVHTSDTKINSKKIFYINYPVKDAQRESYGVVRCSVFHEAVHLKRDHFMYISKDYALKQALEREADRDGVTFANCKECAREYAKHFLDDHNSEQPKHKFSFCEIETLTLQALDSWRRRLFSLSLENRQKHPINLERTINIIIASRDISNICSYHKIHPAQL